MALRLVIIALATLLLAAPGAAQAARPISAAPAAPKAHSEPRRLIVPSIELNQPLISVGLDKHRVPVVPNHHIGWYNLSARPGQGENIVLWGHVLRFRRAPKIPAPFARLSELRVGAPLTIYTADGKAHQYVVIKRVWATPDQVEYILPQGRELVTMVSCIGDKVVTSSGVEMTHRLITIAGPSK